MYLHRLEGFWLDHPFWRSQFLIEDAEDILMIRQSAIVEVWIDTARGSDVPAGAPAAAAAPAPAATPLAEPAEETPIAVEMARAARICDQARDAVVSMLQEARMGKAVQMEAVGALVEEISQSVLRNSGALISLARLKTADDYTYMHSVAVCALMVALARQLQMNEQDVHRAGMAGLLHDIGKAAMPMEVINKRGKLTEAEYAIIRGHPEAGHEILRCSQGVDEVALDVCLHHHEKVDGSGYPHGLAGDRISIFAKMGAVCDVYDAITSNRPYKEGWCPAESLRRMSEWSKGHFDERVFSAFVKSVGIYPVGTLVKMRSSRLGVVVEQDRHSLLAPKVKTFFSIKSNAHLPPEIVDLASAAASDKILSIEDPAQWNLGDLSNYWAGA